MADQDTSAYWRKQLDLNSPLPSDLLKKYRSWHYILRPLVHGVASLVFKYYCPDQAVGLKNLPAKPPYIIAANHLSSIDFPAVAFAMGKAADDLYPLTTSLFYDHWFTGFWIRAAADAVRIDRSADYFVALRAAAGVLRAGGSVYINPEGLRSPDGNLLPFRPGVGVLAVETGIPIVPVHISGTFEALRPGRILPKRNPIRVSFGEPIGMERYIEKKKTTPAYDVYKEVTEELRRRIAELALK